MILLMTIAYSSTVVQGTEIKKMQVQNMYVALKSYIADGVHGGFSARWRAVGELFG